MLLYDGILIDDKKYKVYVKIQDGTEYCGTYSNKGEAVEAYKNGHLTMNFNKDRNPEFYEIAYEFVKIIKKV